ncbi:hypothetical protein IH970_12830 [candidate division KSB1 bacterium]|nr:hypothetical protein [candidate division KSB1 bacterium]
MKEILSLENVDWDFAKAKTNGSTHSFHPYPAKYIPQIPNVLIRELSNEGRRFMILFWVVVQHALKQIF